MRWFLIRQHVLITRCAHTVVKKSCKKTNFFKFCLHYSPTYNRIIKCDAHNHLNGSLVKRLRRRPLTAETGVRFPYELLAVDTAQPLKVLKTLGFQCFFYFSMSHLMTYCTAISFTYVHVLPLSSDSYKPLQKPISP